LNLLLKSRESSLNILPEGSCPTYSCTTCTQGPELKKQTRKIQLILLSWIYCMKRWSQTICLCFFTKHRPFAFTYV
jgi:hypothetical protein